MRREELGDLLAFLAVVDESSFTRAAAKLGASQSAVSHTVRRLEERLGVRLLIRTTRSVSPTDAGKQLAETLRPAFEDIEGRLDDLNAYKDRVSGTIRLTSSKFAAELFLMPVINQLLVEHPELSIEVSVDQRLVDLAASGFDAGVRLGEQVEKDMIAARIGPDVQMVVAGSPGYIKQFGVPKTPHELTNHNCINLRMSTSGGLYAWEFEKNGRALNVRVDGQLTCNDPDLAIKSAMNGLGLCSLPSYVMDEFIADGRLVRVLEDWCPPFPGFHLYYPSRRQHSAAFSLLLESLRYDR